MARHLFLLVIIVALLHEVISSTFILKEANVCLFSGQISQELTFDSKIRCAAVCKDDARCLSFCFNSALQSCRISSIHIDSLQNMVDNGYKMYSLELADAASFGSGFLRFGDKIYQHIATSLNHGQARSHCSGMGASLALPTNDGENEVITSFGYTGSIWILADDDLHKGIWKNTDTDENIIYANWNDNEPNNYGGNENCVAVLGIKKWNDKNCNSQHMFVCEKTIQN